MLKLKRRRIGDFLNTDQEKALNARVASAQKLAQEVEGPERTTKGRYQWGNFRQGKTSKGTFELLWQELCSMSFEKCALCEIPAPSTVEHKDEIYRKPELIFDWNNLLPACGDCNRNRENSGIRATPIDPSQGDPLDYLGWDEYGKFTPNPVHKALVKAHVAMYGLARFDDERMYALSSFRELLVALVTGDPPREGTVENIRTALMATRAWRGPIREYLLRPRTLDDEWLIDEALRRLPDIRTWVKP